MSVPDYQSIMLPLLKFAADEKEHSICEAVENLARTFKLTDEEKNRLLPSGQQAIFNNRVAWARTYMKMAGLLESTKRSFFKITHRGMELLDQNPSEINAKLLKQYPEFIEFIETSKKDKTEQFNVETETVNRQTPEESLEYGYQKIRQDLAQDLLSRIKTCSPSFFERLVVELLVRMGYGGLRKDAGQAIGKSSDGGIDGIIKEDRLAYLAQFPPRISFLLWDER